MLGPWAPVLALFATLLPLLWAKRWITRHLREVSIRWVGDPDVALVFYFVLVLPGIIVHELSHWLMAQILWVRVRRLSIGPVRKGRSQGVSLGSIQVGNVDPIRAALIGLAPLLGGSAVILLIGNLLLGVGELTEALAAQGWHGVLAGLGQVIRVTDFALWLYVIFATSNAMLPSESDMATIRPVFIFLGILAALLLTVGWVSTIPAPVVEAVNAVANYLASAFAVTLVVDVVFMLIIGLLTWITSRLKDR